jgi:hypothetical protein
MNRKEFLQTMAQAGAVAGATLTGLWASIGNAQAAQSVGPARYRGNPAWSFLCFVRCGNTTGLTTGAVS